MAADLVQFLQQEIEVGSFPGASFAIGSVSNGIEREQALGNAVAVPMRIEATPDTMYDIASVTKVAVTTILVLQAVDEKRITLDDRFDGHTFRELLTHTSGLVAWLPLYAFPMSYRETIRSRGAAAASAADPVYSDLNFVLLWYALTEIFGDYVQAARDRIFAPLGLRDTTFNPPPMLKPRIAATEWGQRFEAKMAADRHIEFHGFRQGLMWAEVNDGNSFGAGGTCGNAGVFATARDIFRIVQAFARGELVSRVLVEESTRAHAGDRGLGWQVGELGYGHSGFTGTSVWVKGDRISVLLTNRVHPCAASIAMSRIRTTFHAMSSRA
jgi:CubicO group peptidase (beta-lactamase class C family)